MIILKRNDAHEAESNDNACKYFLNTGKCPREQCSYLHIASQEAKQKYIQNKEKRRKLQTCATYGNNATVHIGSLHDPLTLAEQLGSRHARARIFAKWLATSFFQQNIHATHERNLCVYDIAGGKGEISFELIFRQQNVLGRNIHCIVVDPRNPNKYKSGALPRWQKKIIKVSLMILLFEALSTVPNFHIISLLEIKL